MFPEFWNFTLSKHCVSFYLYFILLTMKEMMVANKNTSSLSMAIICIIFSSQCSDNSLALVKGLWSLKNNSSSNSILPKLNANNALTLKANFSSCTFKLLHSNLSDSLNMPLLSLSIRIKFPLEPMLLKSTLCVSSSTFLSNSFHILKQDAGPLKNNFDKAVTMRKTEQILFRFPSHTFTI